MRQSPRSFSFSSVVAASALLATGMGTGWASSAWAAGAKETKNDDKQAISEDVNFTSVDAPVPSSDADVVKEVPVETNPAAEKNDAAPSVEKQDPVCRPHVPCYRDGDLAVWPRLRLRSGYEYVQPDAQVLFVGNNDGFYFDQIRVGLGGNYRNQLHFQLIFDAVNAQAGSGPNDPVRSLLAATRDAYIAWTPSPYFQLRVGQTFMPVDYEGSQTIAQLNFTRRSVAVTGVRAGHGIAVNGMSPTRQMGIVLGAEKAPMGPVDVEYQFAVSNGNGQNTLGNDNKLPAAYGRVGVSLDKTLGIGLGGSFNPRTVGEQPNLFTETDMTAFGDIRADVAGVELVAQGIVRQTSFNTLVPDPTDPRGQETALGATAWLVFRDPFGISLGGVIPGYRISYYDPSSAFEDDQLLENTIGLRYDLPKPFPVALLADFTILTELGTGVRDLDNNRLTLVAQFEW